MACGRQVQDSEAAKAEGHARAFFGPDTSVVRPAMNQARGHLRCDLKPPLAAHRALIDESCNPAHLLSQELVHRELALSRIQIQIRRNAIRNYAPLRVLHRTQELVLNRLSHQRPTRLRGRRLTIFAAKGSNRRPAPKEFRQAEQSSRVLSQSEPRGTCYDATLRARTLCTNRLRQALPNV